MEITPEDTSDRDIDLDDTRDDIKDGDDAQDTPKTTTWRSRINYKKFSPLRIFYDDDWTGIITTIIPWCLRVEFWRTNTVCIGITCIIYIASVSGLLIRSITGIYKNFKRYQESEDSRDIFHLKNAVSLFQLIIGLIFSTHIPSIFQGRYHQNLNHYSTTMTLIYLTRSLTTISNISTKRDELHRLLVPLVVSIALGILFYTDDYWNEGSIIRTIIISLLSFLMVVGSFIGDDIEINTEDSQVLPTIITIVIGIVIIMGVSRIYLSKPPIHHVLTST